MTNRLRQYFPMIRTREEVLREIENKKGYGKSFTDGNQKKEKNF